MLQKYGMLYLTLPSYLFSVIAYIFCNEQMDAGQRFEKGTYTVSTSMIFFIIINVIFTAQVVISIVLRQKVQIFLLQSAFLVCSIVLSLLLIDLGQKFIYYPLNSVGKLLIPFVLFIGFIGIFFERKVKKILRLIIQVILMASFVIYAVFFFSQGNTIFFDTFSFGVKKSNNLYIAHRSGPSNGPEGTAYTIERTCIQSHPYAVELDIRLTKDLQLILSHDTEIDHYTDNLIFKGQHMIDQPLSVLTGINIGQRWVRADPYGMYQKTIPDDVIGLTLNSADEGIKAIKQYCSMKNGSHSQVMLDIKDRTNLYELFEAIKQLIDRYPDEHFTIRMISSQQYNIAVKLLAEYSNVVFQSTIGMSKNTQYISAIAFKIPEYRKNNPDKNIISWTIQNKYYARILGGTNTILTTDYTNINTNFNVLGGGYMVLVYSLLLVIMFALTIVSQFYQKENAKAKDDKIINCQINISEASIILIDQNSSMQ